MREDDRSRRRARFIPWLVVGAWALGCAAAFWHFELRNLRAFETTGLSTFDSGARARDAESWFKASVGQTSAAFPAAAATVVHIYRRDCPCNRFTEAHLTKIAALYQPRHVRFAALPVDGAPRWVDATPAALVFDAAGRLVYFGPYSDTARCGSAGGFVEKILDKTLAGIPAPLQPILAGGCFCSRPEATA